jgi:hypothetical protein
MSADRAGDAWPPAAETYEDGKDPDIVTFKVAMARIPCGKSTLDRLILSHGEQFIFYWGGNRRISIRRAKAAMMRPFGAKRGIAP